MIKLEGMEDLVRKIEQLGKQGEQIRDKAVKAGGDHLQDKVKENVYSLGLQRRSGQLKDSIVVSDVKDGKVDVGVTNQGEGFYGYFHEFGFYNKRAKKRVQARPFMAPTFEREKANIEKIMADEVKKGLGL